MWYNQWKPILRYILGFSVLIMLGVYISKTDFHALSSLLIDMPYAFCGVLIITFLAYWSASISWWYCIDLPYRKDILSKIWSIRHVGEMLTLFNPTNIIAGDSLKNVYVQKLGVPKTVSRSSVVLSRVLLIASAISLMVLCLPILPYQSIWTLRIDLQIVIRTVLIGLILGSAIKFGLDRFLRSYLYKRLRGSKIFHEFEVTVKHFAQFTKQYPGAVIKGFLFAAGHWILGALEIWVILKVLGHDVSVVDAVIIEMGIQMLKSFGFMIPGQIGVEEYANKIMLTILGIHNNEVWLILSLMRRARQFFWLGVAVVLYHHLKNHLQPLYRKVLSKPVNE